MSHDVLLVRLQPGLSLGWDGSYPSSESRQNVGGSPLTLAVKQPLWQHSSAAAEPQGAYRDRGQAKLPVAYRGCKRHSVSPQVLSTCQNFTGCATHPCDLQHMGLYCPLWAGICKWLEDHTRIVSIIFPLTANCCKLHKLTITTIIFTKHARAF